MNAFFTYLIDWPMRYFYTYGYWRGLEDSNICASLSHYDAAFWHTHTQACDQIIGRQVHAFNVSAVTLLYFILLTYSLIGGLSLASSLAARLPSLLCRRRQSQKPPPEHQSPPSCDPATHDPPRK